MSLHFNRRNVMGIAAGLAGAASAVFGSGANATIPAGKDVEPRGTTGLLERLPTMDLESNEEFLQTFRIWTNELARAASKSADELLKAKGVDPNKEVTTEEAIELLKDDPKTMMRIHMWQHMQMLTWQNLQREFHGSYDAYMAEMEAVDKIGPGKLELNPNIKTPEFATHEIHMQPGGFTGDPFAGHMYYYLSNNFRQGGNNQDELHRRLASLVPVPKDGKVKRILDLGCGIGRMTMGLKVRFPDAEVWGVDIGAPLLRFAHLRGVDFDVDVNYRHALAEETGFPDGYFDIVTSYILHHETPADSSRNILKEAHRILRPGGHYFPIDLNTGGQPVRKNAQGRLDDWVQLRWNHERWWLEYKYLDFAKEMAAAGFDVREDAPEAFPGDKGNLIGYKNA